MVGDDKKNATDPLLYSVKTGQVSTISADGGALPSQSNGAAKRSETSRTVINSHQTTINTAIELNT